MSEWDFLVIRADEVTPFERGAGVVSVPFVGAWSSQPATVTTGTTTFPVDAAIPLHSHNVEETVLLVFGQATVQVGDEEFEIETGDATWVPAGTPHCFRNRGSGPMRIYWVYGGREVTRTTTATGVTVPHLSDADRGAQ